MPNVSVKFLGETGGPQLLAPWNSSDTVPLSVITLCQRKERL